MTSSDHSAATEPAALHAQLLSRTLPQRLALLREVVPGRIVFTTSFGLEDQVLAHAIAASGLDVEIATLDTGRLFGETLDVWAETEAAYGLRIRSVAPERDAVERLLDRDGPFGFRQSPEGRQACCGVRKVVPLGRALAGAGAWLTGLRADQSSHRAATPLVERDPQHDLLKVNPLADWDRERIVDYVRANDVPYNALHDQGFPSIGCAPCTRAVRVGEPERAGRWWWESEARKECGLHDRRPLDRGVPPDERRPAASA